MIIRLNRRKLREALNVPEPEVESTYIIYIKDGVIYAKNGRTGQIEFSGTDAHAVIQEALEQGTGLYYIVGDMNITNQITAKVGQLLIFTGKININANVPIFKFTTQQASWLTYKTGIIGGFFYGTGGVGCCVAEVERIHGFIMKDVYAGYADLVRLKGECTRSRIVNCHVDRVPHKAIVLDRSGHNWGAGGTVIDKCMFMGPSNIAIEIVSDAVIIRDTWFEGLNTAINVPSNADTTCPPSPIIDSCEFHMPNETFIDSAIKIAYSHQAHPLRVKNSYFVNYKPASYCIKVLCNDAEPEIIGNTIVLYNGAHFLRVEGSLNRILMAENLIEKRSEQDSKMVDIATTSLHNIRICNNLMIDYWNVREKAWGNRVMLASDGTTTTFNIPHGLRVVPSRHYVYPINNTPSPSAISVDAYKITLTYDSAPPAGILTFDVYVEV